MKGLRYRVKLLQHAESWRAAVLGLAILALPACVKKAVAPPAALPPPVKVAVAKLSNVPVQFTNIGVVQPVSSVTLQTQVDGIINAVRIQPGQDVRQGQVLFTLDSRPFVAALLQAQAALAQAKANVVVAQAKLDGYQAAYVDALADWRRAQKVGTANGALSVTQYDAYKSTYDQAKANVANGQASLVAARRAVDSAQAGVTTAQINVGYCTIRSPLDGKAGNLQAFVGTNVKATTTNLLVINQMRPIYVSFSLPQSELYPILAAQRKDRKLVVYAHAHGAPGPQLQGYLSFIDNAVNDATGSIQLMGTFANAQEELWPGEFVDATLQVAIKKNAVVVPVQAVQTGQNGEYVFVLQPGHIAQMRRVQEAFSYNDMAVIAKGLSAGETVITDGQLNVIDGKAVEVVKRGLVGPARPAPVTGPSRPRAVPTSRAAVRDRP
ncbi:MAG: efflux RND transporter periplasmic adaptor subunit [Phycisphaerae bacterium]|nr:efflux RND transporter periplasmic adaptor subunit [Phycisphaerae bacterium]